MKWLPNAITSLRIAGGFVAMLYALGGVWTAALWVFLVALLSDFLDGLAAKKLNAITPFGELLDSLADGLLVTAGAVALSATGHLSWWVTAAAVVIGLGVQAERRLFGGALGIPTPVKKMFAIVCLFAALIYIVLAFAALAYGWHWWYVPAVAVILAVSASLKRHRLRTWLAGRS